MDDKAQKFCDAILRLAVPETTGFGTGMPGLAAASMGGSQPSGKVLAELKHKASEFYGACQRSDHEQVEALAHDIEGGLATLQTMSAISEADASTYIDTLYDIVEGK
jgi:hypothetical protein